MTMQLADETAVQVLVDKFVAFLETGSVPDGLFAPDVYADVTLPTWRMQSADVAGLVAIRKAGHPAEGRVPRSRVDVIPTGFVIEFEETWVDGGGHWYSREMARADVSDGVITKLSVYCTGDWSEARVAEHAAAVRLICP